MPVFPSFHRPDPRGTIPSVLDSGVAPTLTFLARIDVDVAAPIDLGPGDGLHRRIVPILGGRVTGPELNGTVLPGGADFQVLRSDTLTELEARYAIETDEGDRVYVENFGLRAGSSEDIAKIVAGEPVDPSRIYFRSNPRISSSCPKWAWLGSRILVARGERLPESVRLEVFVVD
ncbi:UPF0311 protein [Naasia aerilata]|uniref:UPF0311 protein GCM10025866_19450 n=1 Tax=Naasia aerilata TaxID=1162966 RepID=A0ABN6XQT0_9MICO|nr:UPF0311 protein [Naasia aerilata]